MICKLAEGVLDTTVYVINEKIKQHQPQCGTLRDTTCHWCPFGHQTDEHYPLDVTIQTVSYPLNSPPIKSISPQFREKDVGRDNTQDPELNHLMICTTESGPNPDILNQSLFVRQYKVPPCSHADAILYL